MDSLISFIKKTKELIRHLEKGLPKDEREDYIKTIHQLLEERQQCLNNMPDLTKLEEHTKAELVSLEKKLQWLLKNHSKTIKQDIKVLQLKKKKGIQYSNPYGNISADGMFLDKKK